MANRARKTRLTMGRVSSNFSNVGSSFPTNSRIIGWTVNRADRKDAPSVVSAAFPRSNGDRLTFGEPTA